MKKNIGEAVLKIIGIVVTMMLLFVDIPKVFSSLLSLATIILFFIAGICILFGLMQKSKTNENNN